jgi:hypothetical protein
MGAAEKIFTTLESFLKDWVIHAAPLSLVGCLVDVAQTIQKFSDRKAHLQSLIGAIVGGEIHTSAILEPLNQEPEKSYHQS